MNLLLIPSIAISSVVSVGAGTAAAVLSIKNESQSSVVSVDAGSAVEALYKENESQHNAPAGQKPYSFYKSEYRFINDEEKKKLFNEYIDILSVDNLTWNDYEFTATVIIDKGSYDYVEIGDEEIVAYTKRRDLVTKTYDDGETYQDRKFFFLKKWKHKLWGG